MTLRTLRVFFASFELIFAASLWGFGFVAVVWALPSWTPIELIFLRMLIGALAGLLISAALYRNKKDWVSLFKIALMPAFWLVTMLILQTMGLQYTTATKSGFISILYIILVPLFAGFFENRKTPLAHWGCIFLSLAGVILIVDFQWSTPLNVGDVLTFACAICAAMHILIVDKISHHLNKPFLFNSLQSFWSCVLAAVVMGLREQIVFPHLNATPLAWTGLLMLSLGATLIAFYLQIRAQKILSPTVSSLFFLLESPFAMLFAFFFLKESLSRRAMLGAAMILLSALLATMLGRKKRQTA
jgi:drug/metabolite transporter (DMT)-like permease